MKNVLIKNFQNFQKNFQKNFSKKFSKNIPCVNYSQKLLPLFA